MAENSQLAMRRNEERGAAGRGSSQLACFLWQNYDHLFKVNDKSVGGSFYLQSKVSGALDGSGHPSCSVPGYWAGLAGSGAGWLS